MRHLSRPGESLVRRALREAAGEAEQSNRCSELADQCEDAAQRIAGTVDRSPGYSAPEIEHRLEAIAAQLGDIAEELDAKASGAPARDERAAGSPPASSGEGDWWDKPGYKGAPPKA